METCILLWNFVFFLFHVMHGNALVVKLLSGEAKCSNPKVIHCRNRDIPLKFCTSAEPITNKTIVAVTADAFLTCDYQEGPSGSDRGKYFGYNETTIWVTRGCEANFHICIDTTSTQQTTTSTVIGGRSINLTHAASSDTLLSSPKLITQSAPTATSAPTPTDTLPSQRTPNSRVVVVTDIQSLKPTLHSTSGPPTALYTTDDNTVANDTSSTYHVSVTTDSVTTVPVGSVSIATVPLTTPPVTPTSATTYAECKGVTNIYKEEKTTIRVDTWILSGALLVGFAVIATIIGIPLYKLAERTLRSFRVSTTQN